MTPSARRVASLCAAFLLIGLAIYEARKPDAPAWDGATVAWPAFDAVERVVVRDGPGGYTLQNDGERWWLTAPFDALVDERAAASLETALRGLGYDLTRDAATTGAALGFDDPDGLELEVTPWGGSPVVLRVGRCVDRAEERDGCWMRPDEAPTLFRADRDLREDFAVDPRSLRSLRFTSIEPGDIRHVTARAADAEWALARATAPDAPAWSASRESGQPVPVDPATWDRQLARLCSIDAVGFADGVSDAASGLAAPRAQVRLQAEAFEVELSLGGPRRGANGETEAWYARVEGHDAVYLLAPEDAALLEVDAGALRDRVAIDARPAEVAQIAYPEAALTLVPSADPVAVPLWSPSSPDPRCGEGACERAGRAWTALRVERYAATPGDDAARRGDAPVDVELRFVDGRELRAAIGAEVGGAEPGRPSDVWISLDGVWARVADDVARTLTAPLRERP